MTTKLRHIILLILPITVFMVLLSCSKEESDPENDAILSMVTFDSNNAKGSNFTYQAYDDSPEINLYAPDKAIDGIKKGVRTIIYYTVTATEGEKSKTINLIGKINTVFDSLRIASNSDILKMPNNAIKLKSVWRSGNFLNFNFMLQYTGTPRQIMLIVDSDTRTQSVADLYLIDNTMGVDGTFYRQAYMSVFMGNLWSDSRVNTVRVHVDDLNFPNVKYYDFSKTKQ